LLICPALEDRLGPSVFILFIFFRRTAYGFGGLPRRSSDFSFSFPGPSCVRLPDAPLFLGAQLLGRLTSLASSSSPPARPRGSPLFFSLVTLFLFPTLGLLLTRPSTQALCLVFFGHQPILPLPPLLVLSPIAGKHYLAVHATRPLSETAFFPTGLLFPFPRLKPLCTNGDNERSRFEFEPHSLFVTHPLAFSLSHGPNSPSFFPSSDRIPYRLTQLRCLRSHGSVFFSYFLLPLICHLLPSVYLPFLLMYFPLSVTRSPISTPPFPLNLTTSTSPS